LFIDQRQEAQRLDGVRPASQEEILFRLIQKNGENPRNHGQYLWNHPKWTNLFFSGAAH